MIVIICPCCDSSNIDFYNKYIEFKCNSCGLKFDKSQANYEER